MAYNESFNRVEKKYLLTKKQYNKFMEIIESHIEKDEYYFSTINNIYYDTGDFELIRNSIEKPVYKEKMRLRSYGTPDSDTDVFLEIKKKFDGRVYKRRVSMKLSEAIEYMETGKKPEGEINEQIFKEIDFFRNRYDIEGKMFIAYDRHAYVGIREEGLRITFDSNLRAREDDLKLESGSEGRNLFENDERLLEIKCLGAYPMWLVNALNNLEIYPTSFSKYGSFYKRKIQEERYGIKINGYAQQPEFIRKTHTKEGYVCLIA